MTLDEAIQHAEEVMVKNLEKTKGRNASDPIAINCFEYAEEHKKLAKWLKELKQLRDEMLEMPPIVIATAYHYAINYVRYGEDVTEKWVTATQNARALEKAYRKGYHDALHKLTESEE